MRKQITRHMADGTVEHEISEEHKNTTNQTQITEYQKTITHLQSQLQLVNSKWMEAKEECHDLQRNSTALSDVMGTAVCEAVMKKAPGTELTVALLLIPRLLLIGAMLMVVLETRCQAWWPCVLCTGGSERKYACTMSAFGVRVCLRMLSFVAKNIGAGY